MVNVPTRISDCDSNNPALLDLFISFDPSNCPTAAFPPLGNSDVVVSVSIDFPSNTKVMSIFIAQLMTILVLIAKVIVII